MCLLLNQFRSVFTLSLTTKFISLLKWFKIYKAQQAVNSILIVNISGIVISMIVHDWLGFPEPKIFNFWNMFVQSCSILITGGSISHVYPNFGISWCKMLLKYSNTQINFGLFSNFSFFTFFTFYIFFILCNFCHWPMFAIMLGPLQAFKTPQKCLGLWFWLFLHTKVLHF